jgi:hypothetical protein
LYSSIPTNDDQAASCTDFASRVRASPSPPDPPPARSERPSLRPPGRRT